MEKFLYLKEIKAEDLGFILNNYSGIGVGLILGITEGVSLLL